MCYRYNDGALQAAGYKAYWETLEGKIDDEQYNHVLQLLNIQVREAHWWRDACLAYFQTFSRRPFPDGVAKPDSTLEYYKGLKFHYVPGIK